MSKTFALIASRISISLILLFICITIGKSQVPGYLGKRFSLEFTTKLAPAFLLPSQNNNGLNNLRKSYDGREIGLALNHSYNCQINYALNRKTSLGINISQFYTGQVTEMYGDEANNNTVFLKNFHRLHIRTVGLKYDVFSSRRGSIAPIGRFYSLGINALFISGNIIDHIIASSSDVKEYTLDLNQDILTFSFSISYSKVRMITDRLYLKYGSTFSVPLRFKNIDINTANSDNQYEYNDAVYRRILGHSIYSLDLGLGYLIF